MLTMFSTFSFLTMAVLVLTAQFTSTYGCPSSNGKIECECIATTAECFGIQTEVLEIQDILANLSFASNIILKIDDLQFDPDFIYENSSIKNLTLGYGLETLPSNIFTGMSSSLVSLNLQNNSVKEIDDLFSSLHLLTELFLDMNKISELKSSTFMNLSKLNYLSIARNDIQKVSSDVFQNLLSLQTLILSHNNISLLENINIESISLKELEIENCLLEGSLKKDTFSHMPNLEKLDMSYNKLTAVEQQSLSALKNLQFLNLSYNTIDHLDENAFSEMMNLTLLDLKANQIIVLKQTAFAKLENLVYLDLSENKLSSIQCEYTSDFVSLEEIYIQDNQLKEFGYGAFYYSPKLRVLNASGNNFECSCALTDSAHHLINHTTIERKDLDSIFCTTTTLPSPIHIADYENSTCKESEPELCKQLEDYDYDYPDENLSSSTVDNILTSTTTDKTTTVDITKMISFSATDNISTSTTDKTTTTDITTSSSATDNISSSTTDKTTTTDITTSSSTTDSISSITTDKITTIGVTATNSSSSTDITTENLTIGSFTDIKNVTETATTTVTDLLNSTNPTIFTEINNSSNTSSTIVTVLNESSTIKTTTIAQYNFNTNATEVHIDTTHATDMTNLTTISTESENSSKIIPITTTDLNKSTTIMTTSTEKESSKTVTTTPVESVSSLTSISPCSSLSLSVNISSNSELMILKNFSYDGNNFCLKWTIVGSIKGIKQCAMKYFFINGSKSVNLKCPTSEKEIKEWSETENIYKFCISIYSNKKITECSVVSQNTTPRLSTYLTTPVTRINLKSTESETSLSTFLSSEPTVSTLPSEPADSTSTSEQTVSTSSEPAVSTLTSEQTVSTMTNYLSTFGTLFTLKKNISTSTQTTILLPSKSATDITTFTPSNPSSRETFVTKFSITALRVYLNDSELAFVTWAVNTQEPFHTCNLTLTATTQYFDHDEGIFPCKNNTHRLRNVKENDIFKICIVSQHITSGTAERCSHSLSTARASRNKGKSADALNGSLVPLICLLILLAIIVAFIIFKNIFKKKKESNKYEVRAEEEKYQQRVKIRSSSSSDNQSVRFSYIAKENHEVI